MRGRGIPGVPRPFAFGGKDARRLQRSLGTLGGGNHFIEVDRAADGTNFLVIHSGSRNLGKQVAEYYQRLAIELGIFTHNNAFTNFSIGTIMSQFILSFNWLVKLSSTLI